MGRERPQTALHCLKQEARETRERQLYSCRHNEQGTTQWGVVL